MSTPPGQKKAPTPNGQPPASAADLYAQILQSVQGSMSGVSSAAAGKIAANSQIYMSGNLNRGNIPQSAQQFAGGTTMSYDQARLLPRDWMESDPSQLKKLVNMGILNKVPGFDVGMGLPEIVSAWDDLVQASFEMNKNSKSDKKWTPWDVLNTYSNSKMNYGTVRKGDWEYDVATGEKLRYVGPKTKTTSSRDVNLSSAEDVKALTSQVLTQALGRAPTPDEVATYKSTINAQENANPTLTNTTQTLNDQGEVASQSSKTTGGFDAAAQQQLVQDQAAKSPEFAKYQSGTTYWNSLMQMLTGG